MYQCSRRFSDENMLIKLWTVLTLRHREANIIEHLHNLNDLQLFICLMEMDIIVLELSFSGMQFTSHQSPEETKGTFYSCSGIEESCSRICITIFFISNESFKNIKGSWYMGHSCMKEKNRSACSGMVISLTYVDTFLNSSGKMGMMLHLVGKTFLSCVTELP